MSLSRKALYLLAFMSYTLIKSQLQEHNTVSLAYNYGMSASAMFTMLESIEWIQTVLPAGLKLNLAQQKFLSVNDVL